jgi:hypothetical protein
MQSQDLAVLATKQKGMCPFCALAVEAVIVEVNTARRDKCRCPNCGETVFVCRTPACHDYAKGTASWDHELCPGCSADVGRAAAEIGSVAVEFGKAAAKIAGTAVAVAVVAKVKK